MEGMPKSTNRGTAAPGHRRPMRESAPLGIPSDSEFSRFVVERDTQSRIRADKSMKPKLVVRDEV